ncbi:MAG: hypothetical protein QW228_03575 [Candidatus Aenigmatarchaeota archaeon]
MTIIVGIVAFVIGFLLGGAMMVFYYQPKVESLTFVQEKYEKLLDEMIKKILEATAQAQGPDKYLTES